MAHCHWHSERRAQQRCDLCRQPMCSACSTQVAEPPESYRLCPECLGSLEKLVDRGLSLQARSVSSWRAWVGAMTGGSLALAVWMIALSLLDPAWHTFARWVSYVNCGLLSALFALRFTGKRRGTKLVMPAVIGALVVMLIGHYLSANLQFVAYLSRNSEAMRELIDAGIVASDDGWWLPSSLVLPASWGIFGWQDFTVVIAALYVAYAFTHRPRVWQSHRNRPLPRTDEGASPSVGGRTG